MALIRNLVKRLDITKQQYQSLEQLQSVVIDLVFFVLLLITPLNLLQSIIRLLNLGWGWVMYFHLLTYLIIVVGYLCRRRLTVNTKIVLLTFCFTTIAITAAINMEDIFYGAMYGSIATLILVTLKNSTSAIGYQLLLFCILMIIGLQEDLYIWVFIKSVVNLLFSIAMVALIGVMMKALSRSLEMEQVIAQAERKRIYNELHDGLGAHINSALYMLKKGNDNNQQVIETLHDSMDQIRLSIDALSLRASDINALLSSMRHRLGNRLEKSGIKLQWKVEEIPLVNRLNEDDMRHIQYIFYEIISNIIQHSEAKNMSIVAYSNSDSVYIEVADDGIGFDQTKVHTNGIRQMQARASIIKANLLIASTSLSTEIQLIIPRKRAFN